MYLERNPRAKRKSIHQNIIEKKKTFKNTRNYILLGACADTSS